VILTDAALNRLHEPERLAWIATLQGAAGRERGRIADIIRTTARLFDLPIASLNLIDATHQLTFAGIGVEDGATEELSRSLCAQVVAHNAPLLVSDTLNDPRLTLHPAVHSFSPPIRCYYGVPVHAPNGTAIGTLAVAGFQPRDLTGEIAQLQSFAAWIESEWARDHYAQRMEAERALAERFAAITSSIADGVLVFDREGRMVHANRLAEHQMGLCAPLPPAADLLEVIPPGPARNNLAWLIRHGPPRVPIRRDVILRNAHGRETPIEVTLSCTDDEAWFVAIGHDVSERVQHERTLAALSQRFESILEAAADAIVRVNRKGLVEYANSAMGTLLGVPRASLLGINLHAAHHHHRPDNAPYPWSECPTHRAIREATAARELEEVYWRADGTPITVAYSVTPVTDPADGSITGAVMVMRDIEARRRLERLKAAFIANVSHELRTPLTAIKGSLALLLGDAVGAVSEEQRSLLDIAHNSSDRLVRLVNDLLDLGRLDAARLILHKRRIGLGQLAKTAIDGIAAHAQEAKIRIETTVHPEVGPQLEVDADRIVQILTNLLANAIRFSPPGSRVRVSSRVQQREVRISVRDWGDGISPEARDTIFDRFVQAASEDGRTLGGTGLGLAISRELAHAHGGRLGLGNVRYGSIFHLWLPLPVARGEP
jgi:PAS domain S-box-containing protein